MGIKCSFGIRIWWTAVLAALVLAAGLLPAEAATETTAPITYRYTQVSDIVPGQKYVIVDNEHPIALTETANGKMGKPTVTVSDSTMTSETRLTEWTFSGSESGTIQGETFYLTGYPSSFSLTSSSRNANLGFTKADGEPVFKIQQYSDYLKNVAGCSLFYNPAYRQNTGGWCTSGSDDATFVRLYQYTETVIGDGSFGKSVTLTEPYTVTSGEHLDLRGCHVDGTITVNEGGCVVDSATDSFDADAAGSVSSYTGPAVFSVSGKHYAAVTVDGRTQFHRVAASVTAFRFDLAQGEIYLSVESTFRGSVTDDGLCAGLTALTDIGFEIDETVGRTTAPVPGSMFTDSEKPISSIKPTKTVGAVEVVAFPDNEDRLAVHFTFLANLDAVYTLRAKLLFGGDAARSSERIIDLRAALTSARETFSACGDDVSAAVVGRYLAA